MLEADRRSIPTVATSPRSFNQRPSSGVTGLFHLFGNYRQGSTSRPAPEKTGGMELHGYKH